MINSTKTNDSYEMKTINGYISKLVNDYKYFGSYISSSFKDFNTRKGMAWSACNDLHRIWVSDLHVNMKIDIGKNVNKFLGGIIYKLRIKKILNFRKKVKSQVLKQD